jgi:uncharacterized membrane protein YbhN (UPF0104 family)
MSTTTPTSARGAASGAHVVRRVVAAALLSGVMASLVLAVPSLHGVGTQITHMRLGWVVAAGAFEFGSCAGFVVIFRWFFSELPAGAARALAWVEEGSGALLPGGGVGALAIGGWMLHQMGMSTRRIIQSSSALFFLTSAINVIALAGAGALLAARPTGGPHDFVRTGIPIVVALAATTAVLAISMLVHRSPPRRWPGWVVAIAAGVDGAVASLRRPSWRLLGALGYLACDIAALGATFAAAGHPLPVAPLALGYLIGYLANLIPVPGGFGVLEGGLAGTLIAYGAPATQAAAAVVVYHAIAFWIPSLGGLAGYALLRARLRKSVEVHTSPHPHPHPALPTPEPA